MNCHQCGVANPNQARYCYSCGVRLTEGITCQTCFTLLPANARYCFHCGGLVIQNASAQIPVQSQILGQSEQFAKPAVQQPPNVPNQGQAISALESTQQPYGEVKAGHVQLNTLPPAESIQSMLSSLQEFLPKGLYDPLERKPNQKQIDAVRDHITSLLQTTKTYLPRPVVVSPQPAGEPLGKMNRGVFLFGDVSGFTPLSEQLKKEGQGGAERLTQIINDLFFDLVTVLFDHGGALLKFGGDALLGIFEFETEEEKLFAAEKATQASMAMQAIMEKYGEIEAAGEIRKLAIKCGISTGPYFAAHIGTKPDSDKGTRGIMAFVTTGHTVNRAEQAEGHANPGDVVMDDETAALVVDKAELTTLDDGFNLVKGIPAQTDASTRFILQEPPEGDTLQQITYLVKRMDILAPYLSPELISRIVTNPGNPRITPDHRPVTVMFANYLGISDLIEDIGEDDPDLIAEHLNKYFVHMAEVVEYYEGTLARMDQYAVGDRLVIFFGAPRAHEDDPARAVYTAVEMQEAVKKHFSALQTPTGIYRFRQRIGINTGHLFAGNAGAPNLRQEYTLMGDDINMAARLMSNAGWQEIFVSKRTKDFVSPFFKLKDRGELKVKGKEILIPTFEVLSRREEGALVRGINGVQTVFIGRDEDTETLNQYARELFNGRGQIISIIAESGLGKTRISQEFKKSVLELAGDKTVQWIDANGLSFSEQVNYWMAAQVLRKTLSLPDSATEDDVLFAIWEQGEQLMGKETAREVIPFLAHVMGIELEGEWESWVKELDPKVRQKQIFWSATEYFKAFAEKTTTLLVLDDLHYADEASLALFEKLFEVTLHAPLMFILSFRPRREKGCWKLRDSAAKDYHHRYQEVNLLPLSKTNGELMLASMLPGVTLNDTVITEIYNKTGGNPFYLEEVVRSLIDTKTVIEDPDKEDHWVLDQDVQTITVPDTLQGAIVSRIDRLTEDARSALQMAAVIGRSFKLEILKGLSDAEAELNGMLGQLEKNDLISPEGASINVSYFFPNALVQEVAYDNLLVQRKQELHKNVGLILESHLMDQAEEAGVEFDEYIVTDSELMAYHFGLSSDFERAIKYLEIAGQGSRRSYALNTAISYYTKLREIYEQQTDHAGQARALYNMGVIAYEIGRYAEGEEWLALSREMYHKIKDTQNEAWSVMYLGMIALKRGIYGKATKLHKIALKLAQDRKDDFQEGIHLTNLGRVSMRMGEYDIALEQLNDSIQLKSMMDDATGQSFALYYIGLVELFKGEYDLAEEFITKAHRMWTDQIKDKRGEGYGIYGLGLLALKREKFDEAEEYLLRACELFENLVLNAEYIESLSALSLVKFGQGAMEEAGEISAKAIERLETQKDVEEAQGIYYNHYRILTELEDVKAEVYLQRAHEILNTQLEGIPTKKAKKAFMSNVTVNKAILDTI